MRYKPRAKGYRPRQAVGVWLSGGSDLCGEEPPSTTPAEIARYFTASRQARGVEAPVEADPAAAPYAALAVNGSISWNASTTVIRTIHRRMHRQGWKDGQAPEIPCHQDEVEPLPTRPLDLGVGLWR